VFGLYEDSKGNLWAGVTNGLWRWKPGPPRFYPVPDQQDGVRGFGEGDDGALLIGTVKGIRRFVDGRLKLIPFQAPSHRSTPEKSSAIAMAVCGSELRSGALCTCNQGRTDVFAPLNGLSGGAVYTLFEDREDNIWVSTINGLDRFRDHAVPTFSVNQGLSSASVSSVLAAHDGSVWLGTRAAWKDGITGKLQRTVLGLTNKTGKAMDFSQIRFFRMIAAYLGSPHSEHSDTSRMADLSR